MIAARSATQVTFASPRQRADEHMVDALVRPQGGIRQLAQARSCSVELLGFLGLHALAPRHDLGPVGPANPRLFRDAQALAGTSLALSL